VRHLIPQPRATEYDYCAPKTFVTAEQALEHLRRDKFFLLVDVWDPHEPWDPPPHYVQRYLPDWNGKVVNPVYYYYEPAGVTKEDLAIARSCYLAEVTMVDRWMGRLLERIESLGIADETAVLFTTDHGFYFGDHGIFGKTLRPDAPRPGRRPEPAWARSPLYEPLVHIPFIGHVPGAPPARLPHLLSAVDVVPTVLDLLDVPVPDDLVLHGRSFAPLLRGESVAPGLGPLGRDFVVSAIPLANPGEMLGIVDGFMRRVTAYQPATITTQDGWSLLYAARGEPVELYSLPDDPGQLRNLAGAHPDIVKHLHRRYIDLLETVGTADYLLEPRRSL
jgi:arylsulfatase A-like enzyme